jgi:hypothetical protein
MGSTLGVFGCPADIQRGLTVLLCIAGLPILRYLGRSMVYAARVASRKCQGQRGCAYHRFIANTGLACKVSAE